MPPCIFYALQSTACIYPLSLLLLPSPAGALLRLKNPAEPDLVGLRPEPVVFAKLVAAMRVEERGDPVGAHVRRAVLPFPRAVDRRIGEKEAVVVPLHVVIPFRVLPTRTPLDIAQHASTVRDVIRVMRDLAGESVLRARAAGGLSVLTACATSSQLPCSSSCRV